MSFSVCAITVAVMSTQLQLVLLDRNLGAALASVLISVYAMATIGGRFLGGLGVDRFPAHIVGVFAYGIVPAAGLFILGSGLQSPVLVGAAVLIVGIGAGADSIVTAYLIMRFFRFEIFSTVYSLISVAIALSAAGGSLLLSVTIKATGGFDLFFMVAALTVLCGGLPVLLLGRQPPAVREQAPAG